MEWKLPAELCPSANSDVSDDVLIVANGRMYVAYFDFIDNAWYTDNSAGDRSAVEKLTTGVECWAIPEWPKIAQSQPSNLTDEETKAVFRMADAMAVIRRQLHRIEEIPILCLEFTEYSQSTVGKITVDVFRVTDPNIDEDGWWCRETTRNEEFWYVPVALTNDGWGAVDADGAAQCAMMNAYCDGDYPDIPADRRSSNRESCFAGN